MKKTHVKNSSFWSLGICFLVIVGKGSPLPPNTSVNALKGSFPKIDTAKRLAKCSFEMKNLVQRLLEPALSARLTEVSELLGHPLFNKKQVIYGKASPPKQQMNLMFKKQAESELFESRRAKEERSAATQKPLPLENLSLRSAYTHSVFEDMSLNSMTSKSRTYVDDKVDCQSTLDYFSETEISQHFYSYIFEKNAIIFLMDSSKKLQAVNGAKAFEALNEIIVRCQIYIVKKAYTQNHFMYQTILAKINKFNI